MAAWLVNMKDSRQLEMKTLVSVVFNEFNLKVWSTSEIITRFTSSIRASVQVFMTLQEFCYQSDTVRM